MFIKVQALKRKKKINFELGIVYGVAFVRRLINMGTHFTNHASFAWKNVVILKIF
jgi:hypothetical protein